MKNKVTKHKIEERNKQRKRKIRKLHRGSTVEEKWGTEKDCVDDTRKMETTTKLKMRCS